VPPEEQLGLDEVPTLNPSTPRMFGKWQVLRTSMVDLASSKKQLPLGGPVKQDRQQAQNQ
jgi:hypothetical protein